jgi:hypothetical protein
MNKKRAVVTFCCITFYLVGVSSAFGQEGGADLKDKRVTIRMEARALGDVFRYLMQNYDIPIGFEESVLDRGHSDYAFETNLPSEAKHRMQSTDGRAKAVTTARRVFEARFHPITLYVEDGTVEQVFDEIIRQMENYKWEINDGVVNIFPVKGRDKRFEELLGMNVERFTLEKGKTVDDITTNIMSLPEFRSFERKHKLHFTGARGGNADFVLKAQYGRVIDAGMDFSNLTFRDLLNRITKVKRGAWRIRWKWISKTTGEEHIDIDI